MNQFQAQVDGKRSSGLAITSMVLGIVSIPLIIVCVGPLLGIAAIITGVFAITNVRKAPERFAGKGQAIAGVICGAAGMLLGIPVLLGIFLPAFAAARSEAHTLRAGTYVRAIGSGIQSYAQGIAPQPIPEDRDLLLTALVAEGLVRPDQADLSQWPCLDASIVEPLYYVPGSVSAGESDPDVVLVFEHPGCHNRGGNAYFANGVVEVLDEMSLRTALLGATLPNGDPYVVDLR